MSVALIYQPYVAATLEAARMVAVYLDEMGQGHELHSAHDLGCSSPEVSLAVCFGGDGTALRTARWLSGRHVPVVSVRMGKLSFLGEVSPSELPGGLQPYLAGEYWRDERAMLDVSHNGQAWVALNDAVLVRGESPRAVHIEVLVDGASAVRYLADGVVVSTATGSTAYSLAAGGPVLAPSMRAMVVTPVAPHLTALKSLVLPDTAVVRLVNRGYAPTLLTVDGQVDLIVEPNDSIEMRVSDRTSVFARRGARSSFYEGLADKLHRG